jgi:hypothetical protein
MLPLMPRFTAQMVNRSGRQLGEGALETPGPAPAKSHRRRHPERHANDMLEHRAVPMSADTGAAVVADQQSLTEVFGKKLANRAALSRSGSNQSGIGSAGARRAVAKS